MSEEEVLNYEKNLKLKKEEKEINPPSEKKLKRITQNENKEENEGFNSNLDTDEEPEIIESSKPHILSSKIKKRRGKLPEQATSTLKKWLFEHCYHPYPTEDEKTILCASTNLTLNQINNWFTNARRRILPKAKPISHPSSFSLFSQIPINSDGIILTPNFNFIQNQSK